MPTINFDFNKFCDSQFYGYPKNGNWAKYPQWVDEVVSSNHEAMSAALQDTRQAHRFTGYKSDVYFDASGDVSTATWQDHMASVVEVFNSVAPVITEITVPAGQSGVAYTHTFTAEGAAPIVWTKTGALPTGITLTTAGVMAGTPSVDGAFPLTIIATNAKGFDEYEITLTIAAP